MPRSPKLHLPVADATVGKAPRPGRQPGTSCGAADPQTNERDTQMADIESVLRETRVCEPSPEFVAAANVSRADYEEMVANAEKDYAGYWAKLARDNLVWRKPFTKALDESNAPFYKWFEDGLINASYNCLDRHLDTIPNHTAIIFEADDGKVTRVSYKELYHRVCQFA